MSFLPDFRAKNILRPKVLENNNYFKSAVNEALISSKVFQKRALPATDLRVIFENLAYFAKPRNFWLLAFVQIKLFQLKMIQVSDFE